MERLGLGDIVFFYSAVIADQDGIEIASSYCMRVREGGKEQRRTRESGGSEEGQNGGRRHMALKFFLNDPEPQ